MVGSLWLWVASLLLLSPLSSGQQCLPASRPVAVSLSCLELEEAATPPQEGQLAASSAPVVTTSSGLFDWWYTIPNLIVATTQTRPLPKGDCRSILSIAHFHTRLSWSVAPNGNKCSMLHFFNRYPVIYCDILYVLIL